MINEVDVLKNIMSSGYGAISYFAKQIADMNLTDEEMKMTEKTERTDAARQMFNMMAIVNNVIHAGHEISREWYPNDKPFIDNMVARQKLAREAKLVACQCCEPLVEKEAPKEEIVAKKPSKKKRK